VLAFVVSEWQIAAAFLVAIIAVPLTIVFSTHRRLYGQQSVYTGWNPSLFCFCNAALLRTKSAELSSRY